MKALAGVLLVTFSLTSLWRETNSRADARRGLRAWSKGDYASAAKSFKDAERAGTTPAREFNRGTAEIAAGNREGGSAILSRALTDPKLKAAALFNRGNAALASNAYDYAIRDYRDVLRMNPNDAAAKRNLEIAIAKKRAAEEQKKASSGGTQPQPSPQPQQKPQQQQPAPREGEQNADALLRSVQQQEQEELARMRMQRARSVHVGW